MVLKEVISNARAREDVYYVLGDASGFVGAALCAYRCEWIRVVAEWEKHLLLESQSVYIYA